ncbi:hypothetical protein L484_028105 [Morus notabilis]|uniref:Uncharacterized protein n=1 Tax=Morus notabilis TaxID=981085 RepID=W9SG29_9ROSA|nr:hypothetical protein L484_028105 [Morus notabilis]
MASVGKSMSIFVLILSIVLLLSLPCPSSSMPSPFDLEQSLAIAGPFASLKCSHANNSTRIRLQAYPFFYLHKYFHVLIVTVSAPNTTQI